ncbi:hypothetical protein BJX99DRAFT_272867 [Aspergillus californicus]
MAISSKGRRQIRACQRCRSLKVGCDTQKPTCARCLKAGVHCTLSDSTSLDKQQQEPIPIGSFETTDSSATEGPSPDETGVAVADLGEPSALPVSSQCFSCTIQKRKRAPISCTRCRRLKVRCDRQSPCSRCAKGKSACTYPRLGQSIPRHSDIPSKPISREAEWGAKFRSDVHWIQLAREVDDLLRSNGVEPVHDEHPAPPERPRVVVDYPFGPQETKARTVLLTYLPSRGVADMLMDRYLETIERTHHFLHVPTFRSEVERFWQQPLEAEDDWLAMFCALLYLGCEVSQSRTDSDDTMSITSNQLVEASRGFLHRTSFMAYPNLHAIRTLCLIVVAKQTSHMSCDSMESAWCLTGLITRLAITMGLHSPIVPHDQPETVENQIRRVLWTTVSYLDLRQSLLIGMPLLLPPRIITGSAPANIRYNDIASLLDEIPGAPSMLEKTESTFHVLLAHAFPLASRLVDLSHSPDQPDAYDVAVHLTSETKRILQQASGTLRKTIPGSNTGNTLCPEDLEAIMFDILFRGLLLSAHQRFARAEHAAFQYPVSYWTTLDCSLAVLVHQRDLWELRNENCLLARSFGRLFWPDFLNAALTLSSYLLQGDSLLDPPGCCAAHARVTLREALNSCRDIWLLVKDTNICHSKAFSLIDRVVSVLNATPDTDTPGSS